VNSCLYIGKVIHRRHLPRKHLFQQRLFMLMLDLRELPQLFDRYWLWSARRPALACFRRTDYHGDPQATLDHSIRARVAAETGQHPVGPIFLLTHLRYFGHNFNPVSFYYIYDSTACHLETVVAEITNTPWRERHCYVLPVTTAQRNGNHLIWEFDKQFHVSPFMPMNQHYHWQIDTPAQRLQIAMHNHQDGQRVFDAFLRLQKQPINSFNLAKVLLLFPLMTMQVLLMIHWQALRLWWKKIPFFAHPDSIAQS
jgi:uncharacterized protein